MKVIRVLSRLTLVPGSTPIALLVAALMLGCAAPAEHPALDQARAAIERARSAPRVRALAPAELDRAEVALEHARAAARAGAPPDQVEHLAYVVSQRAALAEVRAAERVARSEIEGLQGARGQVLAHRRLEQDRQARASLGQRDQQPRAPLEEGQQARASLGQRDQQTRAPLEDDQQDRASLEDDQQTGTADPLAAIVETVPQEITLSLAQLSFADAEPTSEALEHLAALAQRLLREPRSSLSIVADFDLPDPEARTSMERRVEVVRAILLERGVAPARLIVRAGGDGPAEPQAASSFLEPTE